MKCSKCGKSMVFVVSNNGTEGKYMCLNEKNVQAEDVNERSDKNAQDSTLDRSTPL